MIKNIIFDIGDVLMRFTWNEYINELFNGDTTTIDAVNEAINETGLWIELDRNVIPEEEVFYRMRNYNPAHWKDVVKALDYASGCFNRVDYAIPWIEELKAKGYKIYFLSNYSLFNLRSGPEVVDFLPFTDGGVFSYEVHLLKPDRAIYEEICKKYSLMPSECIFIDDRKENVEAARTFGMQAIHFKSYEDTDKELQEMLNQ